MTDVEWYNIMQFPMTDGPMINFVTLKFGISTSRTKSRIPTQRRDTRVGFS